MFPTDPRLDVIIQHPTLCHVSVVDELVSVLGPDLFEGGTGDIDRSSGYLVPIQNGTRSAENPGYVDITFEKKGIRSDWLDFFLVRQAVDFLRQIIQVSTLDHLSKLPDNLTDA